MHTEEHLNNADTHNDHAERMLIHGRFDASAAYAAMETNALLRALIEATTVAAGAKPAEIRYSIAGNTPPEPEPFSNAREKNLDLLAHNQAEQVSNLRAYLIEKVGLTGLEVDRIKNGHPPQ